MPFDKLTQFSILLHSQVSISFSIPRTSNLSMLTYYVWSYFSLKVGSLLSLLIFKGQDELRSEQLHESHKWHEGLKYLFLFKKSLITVSGFRGRAPAKNKVRKALVRNKLKVHVVLFFRERIF